MPKSKQKDLSILKKVSSAHEEKECLKNGLRILAKIIIRKYNSENIEKDWENDNERKSISNRRSLVNIIPNS